jgi:succinate dehydrogenase / fumarate reductase flavoprotein subunit
MQDLVGLIRTQSELDEAIRRIGTYRERLSRVGVKGGPRYNPGWNLALDLVSLLSVSEIVARAASTRTESRGGHTRDDFPATDAEWGTRNVIVRQRGGRLAVTTESLAPMPPDLRGIIGDQPKPAEHQGEMESTQPAGMGAKQ